jgi:hypothetical protein
MGLAALLNLGNLRVVNKRNFGHIEADHRHGPASSEYEVGCVRITKNNATGVYSAVVGNAVLMCGSSLVQTVQVTHRADLLRPYVEKWDAIFIVRAHISN